MTSYSQHGEDRIVLDMFGGQAGLLLEIGAWGVRDFSNSRAFIEAGWEAVLVEFSPMPVHSLVLEYGYNPKVTIVQAAVTVVDEGLKQFDITENALSTANHDMKQRWADACINYYGLMWIPTVPLDRLIRQFFADRRLDYVSIDTEGTSFELACVLMSMGAACRPRVLVIEYDEKLDVILEKAKWTGYRSVHQNETNVILEAL